MLLKLNSAKLQEFLNQQFLRTLLVVSIQVKGICEKSLLSSQIIHIPFPKSSNTYRYENLTEEQSNILFAFENAPTRVSSQFLDLLGYYFPRSIDIPRYPNLTEDQNINLYAYENAPESVRKRVYKLLADYFPKASQSSEPESLTKEQRLILNAYAHSTDTVRKRVINLLNLTNKIEL